MHCQGGKGRTGTFCAALLLWTGYCSTAEEALDVFARRRTDPSLGGRRLQGVDSPSQRRYVGYLERVLCGLDYAGPRRTLLTRVSLVEPPLPGQIADSRRVGGSEAGVAWLSFVVECFGTVQYDFGKRHGAALLKSVHSDTKRKVLTFALEDPPMVAGDVTVRFFIFKEEFSALQHCVDLGRGARTARYGRVEGRQLCFVTLHTSFHRDGSIVFARSEVDGAYNKSEKVFPASFAVKVTLDSCSVVATVAVPPSPSAVAFNRTPSDASDVRVSPGSGVQGAILASLGGSAGVGGLFHHPSIAAAAAPEAIPYGLGVGQRLLLLHEAVAKLFASACPMQLTLRRGDCMWTDGKREGGSECDSDRTLFLIVSGIAEYAPATGGERSPRINRGNSIARIQV